MRKNATLTWTLILLVLLPSGVLAWLGLRSADAFEASELQRLRTDVMQEAERWRARGDEARETTRAAIQAVVDRDAAALAERIPGRSPTEIARLVERLRSESGALGVVAARVLDARGRVLFPVPYEPSDSAPAVDLRTRGDLLAQLRWTADRAYYAPEDGPTPASEDAAIAVWAAARQAAAEERLRAAIDVEIARVYGRAGLEALLLEVASLERRWNEALLIETGRPAIVLWLALLTEAHGARLPNPGAYRLVQTIKARMLRLVWDGHIDAIPLTRDERARCRGWSRVKPSSYLDPGVTYDIREARGLRVASTPASAGYESMESGESAVLLIPQAGSNSGPYTPPALAGPPPSGVVFASDMPGGARLEVTVSHDALAGWYVNEADLPWSIDTATTFRAWAPAVRELRAGARPRGRSARAFEEAATTDVPMPLPGGAALDVRLEVNRWREVYASVGERRTATGFGVLALLLVTVVGAWFLRRAILREREARRIRDDFIANVTHEVRTPLTSVLLHSELLVEEDDDEAKRREHAAVVQAQGQRLAALVGDMLDFAALERGTRTLESAPVDLAAACRDAVAPYRVLAEREGADVTFVEPAGSVEAMADPAALARILGNLVGNAWKHGRPSRDGHAGRLRIVARADGSGAVVEVRDDGPGIPAAERERVFERFGRGRGAIRKEGSGIGLSLSKDLARAMGGDLSVQEEGGETVFRLRLAPVPDLDPDAPYAAE